jgi:hypothetical protein
MPSAEEHREDLISTLGLRSMFLRERLLESDTDDEAELVGTRARAAANIKEWQRYLPADCVSTMLRLGWHLTT